MMRRPFQVVAAAAAFAVLASPGPAASASGVLAPGRSPAVVTVSPTGPTVPENLLRFSLRFAAPVQGPVLPRLALWRAGGGRIDSPFLEQELWSADARVLTVLLHPGRVKQELVAREELGPLLSAGDDLTLTLDGHPLKHWHAQPADLDGPEPAAWRLSSVRVASRQPLVVALDGPIDGLDAGYVAVADERGQRVRGSARLDDGETRWTFTPAAAWRGSTYRLVVRATLEDPSGNRVESHFETPADEPPGPAVDAVREFAPQR